MLPYTDVGSSQGATLVLMHFYGGARREWTDVMNVLAHHQRCIALDMPGFGDAHEAMGFDTESMVSQVDDTIQALGLERVVLVGHSFSGKVAQVLASRAPDYLERLVLVGSSPLAPQPDAPQDREFQRHYQGDRAGAEQFVRSACAHPLPPAVFERAVEDAMRGSRAAWKAWPTTTADEDWSTRVGVLSLPTLVVVGEQDPALPLSIQQRLVLPHIATPVLVVLPGVGHLMPMECPARLAKVITDFMAHDKEH